MSEEVLNKIAELVYKKDITLSDLLVSDEWESILIQMSMNGNTKWDMLTTLCSWAVREVGHDDPRRLVYIKGLIPKERGIKNKIIDSFYRIRVSNIIYSLILLYSFYYEYYNFLNITLHYKIYVSVVYFILSLVTIATEVGQFYNLKNKLKLVEYIRSIQSSSHSKRMNKPTTFSSDDAAFC